MTVEEIMEIVKKHFDEEISAEAWGNVGTSVTGKQEFLRRVEHSLEDLFKENDLSK